MSDFLGAVVRRVIGDRGGLRPAAPPWIPPADERGWSASGGRPVLPTERPPLDAPRPDDGGAELATPVEVPMAPPPAEHPFRRGRRQRPTADVADNQLPETIERALTDDQPPSEARRPDRPVRSEPSSTEHPTSDRGRPSASREPLEAEALPLAPRAVPVTRVTEPRQPDGAVRPLAAVDRSPEDGRWGERTPVGGEDDTPIVHVSIGRIEVRAPQPPPARPAPEPIAPGVSLDAYLRRRDEAERR